MQDATKLCDRVAFIVDGQMKALDTPHNFIMQRGAAKVTYSYVDNNKEIVKTSILLEKSQRTINSIAVSPVTTKEYILGKVLSIGSYTITKKGYILWEKDQ